MKIIYLTFICASIMFITSGCIKNDDKDCPPSGTQNVIVYLDYRNSSGDKGLSDILQTSDFYLFDEDQRFIKAFHFDRNTSLNPNGIELGQLPTGKYKLVSWLNRSNISQVNIPESTAGSTNFSKLFITNIENEILQHKTSDLLYSKTVPFEVLGNQTSYVHIPVKRQFGTGKVLISGLSPQITPLVKISGSSAGYDYNGNVFQSDNTHTYSPTLTPETETGNYSSTFNMLRPKNSDPLKLEIFNAQTGNKLYEVDMIQVFNELNIDPEHDDDVDFVIRIDFTANSMITIWINDWHTTQYINPEF